MLKIVEIFEMLTRGERTTRERESGGEFQLYVEFKKWELKRRGVKRSFAVQPWQM